MRFNDGQSFSRSTTGFDIGHMFVVATLNKVASFDFLIDSGTVGTLSRYEMFTGNTGLSIARDAAGGGPILYPAASYVDGSVHVVSGIFAGAASAINIDGVQAATGTISAASAPTSQICIGRNIISSGNFLVGDVYEAMVYTTADALTPTQVTAVETYLKTKYAIA